MFPLTCRPVVGGANNVPAPDDVPAAAPGDGNAAAWDNTPNIPSDAISHTCSAYS